MHPIWFCVFLWERLSWFGDWIDGTDDGTTKVAGHGTTVGAITFAVFGVIALGWFLYRKKLAALAPWSKWHPAAKVIAVTIGVILGTPLAAVVLMCLTKYLTFASATATTIGVLLALATNNRTHDREETRFIRQGKAATAALSLELSAVCDYCKQAGEQVMSVQVAARVKAFAAFGAVEWPPPPLTAVATLKDMITSTRDDHIADRCALILVHLQLVKANLRMLHDRDLIISPNDVESKLLRITLLYAIASSLFDYARKGDTTLPDITWSSVDNSASSLGVNARCAFYEYFESSKEIFPDGPLTIYRF